jgi:hypothetical protein
LDCFVVQRFELLCYLNVGRHMSYPYWWLTSF